MLLGSFAAYTTLSLASAGLISKMIYADVNKYGTIKNTILNDGLYHITKPEIADKILQDGSILPSNVVSSLGRKKVFFFAGIPNVELLKENIAELSEQYEWTAIKLLPTEDDLSNYKVRPLGDNSITFKGKCDLENRNVQKVNLVVDLTPSGELTIREKTQDETEKGEYVPSEELKQKLSVSKNPLQVVKNLTGSTLSVYKRLFNVIKSKFTRGKSNLIDNVENQTFEDKRNDFLNELAFDENVEIDANSLEQHFQNERTTENVLKEQDNEQEL